MVDEDYRTSALWDYMDNKTGGKFRVVYIFAVGQEKPIAQADINLRVITAPEWESDRLIKSLDAAYVNGQGQIEIEYFDLSGKLCADTLPPYSKFILLKDGKSIKITKDREYAA
ncbi:hypothetical protein [Pectinatus frisingensis]|uniref:hypothetical protein n=1 Tax=Pectinatus frisingensis TaxID=865 RepID=UPI0018C7495A|nr:hypothetical protein [Pectinatus frisingensis]